MSRHSSDAIAGIFGLILFIGWFLFCIALVALKLWLVGSLITSSVKAISHDCGKTYGVEPPLSGNWFCPTEK